MYNQIDLSAAATDDKRLFLAYWPGEDLKPEVWTYETVKKDFGESFEIMSLVKNLEYGEELCYKEGNLVLLRIPSYINVSKSKYSSYSKELK